MTPAATCTTCQHPVESVSHVLRDCPLAVEVWNKIGVFNTLDSHWLGSTEDWICKGLRSTHGMLFGITCWHIWRARNERIFSGSTVLASVLAFRATSWAKLVADAHSRTIRNLDVVPTREMADVAWDPGPIGWVTCNSDGSVDMGQKKAAVGGLVRDAEGRCLLAFTMNLGNCSITRAEMRGAIEGLRRAWDAGFRKVILQLDSKSAISLLTSEDATRSIHALEITCFKEMQSRDWEVVVRHTYREGNRAADFLASIGYGYPFGSHSVPTSDCNLGYFLRYDCADISVQRPILIND
ncbi:Putative ribonuclease H protein At1g65750 [Linum perenne]